MSLDELKAGSAAVDPDDFNALIDIVASSSGGVPDPSEEPDGDVLTVESGAAVWAAGGGSQPGAARVIGPFPFAFDDANLVTGIAFYTPVPGDILLDVWIEVVTAWNGTTPTADVGFIADGGLYGYESQQVNMTEADDEEGGYFPTALYVTNPNAGTLSFLTQHSNGRVAPGRFRTTVPLAFWVSTNGGNTDPLADPGASQGEAHIFIVVATPDAP